jgi:hypothetical protein
MKKMPVFSIFFLVLALSAAAQDSGNFIVSRVSAEARNNLIRLTWVDSPDAKGPVYIFRSSRPFSGSVPANLRPVTVKYGEQYYIDDSDDLEIIYYFVAASDVSGRRYDTIIPRVNSTNVNISGTVPEEVPDQIEPEVSPVQGISNLAAKLDGERVMITFDVNGPRKNAVLYRSTRPVKEPHDLLNAVMVQSGLRSPFIDYPVPGLSYYYTLIFEDEISSGSLEITPGVNATISAVTVYGGGTTERALRPIPLPAMTLNNALPDGYFLPDTTSASSLSGALLSGASLSDNAVKALKNSSVPEKAPIEQRTPRIFRVDLQSPSGGEDSALFDIISESFVKRDWEKARVDLQHYLSLPRSKDVEARARFYLGQTLYFTGNYKGALFEFLSIKSIHPVEANMWIDSILAAMVY